LGKTREYESLFGNNDAAKKKGMDSGWRFLRVARQSVCFILVFRISHLGLNNRLAMGKSASPSVVNAMLGVWFE